jgi:PAS domain S-box-containing protein
MDGVEPRRSSYDIEQLGRLFQQGPAPVAWLDGPRHVYRFINDAYQQLVGARDLVGKPVDDALPELRAQGYIDVLDQVYASGVPYVGSEVRVQLHHDPQAPVQERVLDFVFQPVRDERNRVTGIFIQATDATQRVAAQAALRESEEKFRAITNSIDQMIWSTQPDGFHDFYNERWYEYTGVPRGTTDGAGWNGMFHEDDQKRAWAVWRHSLATGEPYHIEYRLRHHSGAYRWVLGRAQPMRDAAGRIVRWFGTCTDIQAIVDAREVLSRSREELERQVQLRTSQLLQAEDQLRQAQKMEAIGQLTGGIAHDFNNMLQGIVGALDVIKRLQASGRGDSVPRFVDMAMGSAQRAAAMTHRLLAFSRQQPLTPQRVDVAALVLSMRELLRRTAGDSIALAIDLQPRLWATRCDPNQLESALLNLAINARDAMPGGGTLTVRAANEQMAATPIGPNDALAAGEYVRISVADTGEGMSADVVARAFDPFFTTKAIGQGTGLGLSMVYGFARQSGGLAAIGSRPGAGTTVSLLLPRHTGETVPEPAPPAAARLRGSAGTTVLVVEDDEVVRTLVVEALRELEYDVHAAGDGHDALALLARLGRVDLLLSDIGLPGGISGKQLAREARGRQPDLKVLLMTGYALEVVEADLVQERIELIAKPFLIDVLLRRVEDLTRAPASSPGE